jgi:hypothetical protein
VTRRRRIFGLALVALAVPFPALALDGGGSPAAGTGPQSLTVTASLDSCGLAGAQILCKINAGWNSIDGAENYAVSVTSADGSVVDFGETSGQGTSVWVPYVGSGTYSVTVTAWGTPPGEEEDGSPEVIVRSTSKEGGVSAEATRDPVADPVPGESREVAPEVPEVGEEPVVPDEVSPIEPREETPVCEVPPPPVSDTPVPLTQGDEPDADEAEAQAASPAEPAEVPSDDETCAS